MIHDTSQDEFADFKANQRDVWAGFAANESLTTPPAGELVAFAQVRADERVLDVGCGTGVVAVTAARFGAEVTGLDLTPVLLERARDNAALAGVKVEFVEGDAEHLPFADGAFDSVLSQFGHIFAPRPELALAEMLRVLKPGGRIAFTTWPPEHVMGQIFSLVASHVSPPPADAPRPAAPPLWGDPSVVRERLGERVRGLRFSRGAMLVPALSAAHVSLGVQATLGPLKALLAQLDIAAPEKAATLRERLTQLIADNMEGNVLRQHFLMTTAVKATPAPVSATPVLPERGPVV